MSSFAAKRKARVIQTFDDDGNDPNPQSTTSDEGQSDQSAPIGRIRFGRNKPAKSSALRKSIHINDELEDDPTSTPATSRRDNGQDRGDEDDSGAPVVVRPTFGRAGSSKVKKRPGSTRLSFGPGTATADVNEDNEDSTGGGVVKPFTPKKPLGQRILGSNALRKSASLQNLAENLPMRFGAEEETPKYSKEYLEELQSSTPNTPQNLASLQIHDEDEMELDQAELEGALVVQSTEVAPPPARQGAPASILTETEIRERKERRARLAKEADFISFDDNGSENDDEQRGGDRGGGRLTVNFPNKKKETPLIAEDEDLGEGYDEFVSDGQLALGKRAERDAVKRHRKEMADLIQAAEDGSDAESDDSEAERRAAYEAAQRRAGMDGLRRPDEDLDANGSGFGADGIVIPRMKPLPKLKEVMQRMRETVQGLEDEVNRKQIRIQGLEKEKEEILAREKEVQEILNQAGAKYQAAVASAGGGHVGDVAKVAMTTTAAAAAAAAPGNTQSPLPGLPPGLAGDLPVERGLESFGATPTRREDTEEMA
ncbi:nineteen complex-related protein 2-domain-containing protein [Chaetomium sp. MPI-SDFR-AT-0129]|nr:nineteen complex-related protein 2-domain-containing protein [Chaetomium sp. MPI-SDFR-AT-0129]